MDGVSSLLDVLVVVAQPNTTRSSPSWNMNLRRPHGVQTQSPTNTVMTGEQTFKLLGLIVYAE